MAKKREFKRISLLIEEGSVAHKNLETLSEGGAEVSKMIRQILNEYFTDYPAEPQQASFGLTPKAWKELTKRGD